jgi:copper chaperone CopZ
MNAHATSRLQLLDRKWIEMARTKLEIPVRGMDCAECSLHVQHALAALPGVEEVHVLLSSEKAVLQVDPALVDLPTIRKAVEGAVLSLEWCCLWSLWESGLVSLSR